MILQFAKMTLCKWCINSPQLIANTANINDDPHFMLELNDNDIKSKHLFILRLRSDQLLFKVSPYIK